MTSCSAVIPVSNRSSLTKQCLDALLETAPDDVSLEIVVVDDASSDSTPRLLAAYGERLRVVRHEQRTGFAGACNDGAAAATGDWLVFLNNDTIPQPGWLDSLLRYATLRPQIGVVSSKLLFPDDTIQHAGLVFGRDLTPRHVYTGFPADHPATNKSREFQVVTGACALIRRALFTEVGGFDTAYLNAYEDVDLCLRLRQLRYEVHYCHESVLYHLESATRDHRLDPRNHRLFLERWSDVAFQDDLQYYLEDGLIDITYWEDFPALLRVAPQLAVVDGDRASATERFLAQRSRQVFEARKENARLQIELLEAREQRQPSR